MIKLYRNEGNHSENKSSIMPCKILTCQSWCYIAPMRHVVGVLLIIGVMVLNIERSIFSIAIVEMVLIPKKTKRNRACTAKEEPSKSVIENIGGGKYDWDEEIQSILLMIFYIGYVPVQFIAGWLSDRFGARYPLFISSLISGLTCFIIPPLVMYTHWGFVAFVRLLQGAMQAFLFPCVSAMFSRWIPPHERASFGGPIYAANSIGIIIGTSGSGFLISYFESWLPPFFIFGFIAMIYCILLLMYAFSSPEQHRYITSEELIYIKAHLKEKDKIKTPFCKIFKDICAWGIIVAEFGHGFVIFLMMGNIPKYMNNVLQYNIKQNALASCVPFLFIFISSLISGTIADYLITKKNLRIEFIRKLYTAISVIFPALFLLLAVYMKCNRLAALSMFALSSFFTGPFYSGLKVNVLDVTKNHAGVLISLENGLGAIGGVLGPFVIGKIAYENTLAQWEIVMWLVFAISVATAIFYCIFANSTRRKWDYLPGEEIEEPRNPKIPWYNEWTKEDFEALKIKAIETKEANKEAKKHRLRARI